MMLDAGYKAKQIETKEDETARKIITPKQTLQRLPVALASKSRQ